MKLLIIQFISLFLLLNQAFSQDTSELTELRGVWLTNVDSEVLDSREGIREAMQFLADHHFNVVFPVVWNAARTIYVSQVMDSVFGFPIDERFAGRDPLAESTYHRQRRWLDILALKGALLGLVVILELGAFANRCIFFAPPKSCILTS